jgi:hypothetical protein
LLARGEVSEQGGEGVEAFGFHDYFGSCKTHDYTLRRPAMPPAASSGVEHRP